MWEFLTMRATIAREMDLHYAGSITANDPGLMYVEDANLRRFTKADELVGGTIWTGKRTGAGGWNDPQWRRITGFTPYSATGPAYPQISVEYPLHLDADETDLIGDPYEIFRALTPDQWTDALKRAIEGAWPAIFEVRGVNPVTQTGTVFTLPEYVDQVLYVQVEDNARFPGFGARDIPATRYSLENHQSNRQPVLRFARPLPAGIPLTDITVYTTGRYVYYDPYSATSLYNLDEEYTKHQTKAHAYGMLADETQRQAAHQNYMTQAQYYQGQADKRRQIVASSLTGRKLEGASD